MPTRPCIGVVGTFDVENFGDLIFPLITERELTERLGDVEVRLYSYRAKPSGDWPYDVRSLQSLPGETSDLDLLIVGAGHLIRFDKDVAPGYGPPDGLLHHPTAYWLMPTLLAVAHGVPVAWNSLSVSQDTPAWATSIVSLALRETQYVSVRDEPSRRELIRVARDATIELIPDIALGIRSLLPGGTSRDLQLFLEASGINEPYVVVQPSPLLAPHARQIAVAIAEIRRQGLAVLELPISPILGDEAGLLGYEPPSSRRLHWPQPLLLAEIISQAEAVIAQSLHLSIVALAFGVPVHRFRSHPDSKYVPLDDFAGVHFWNGEAHVVDSVRRGIGRRAPFPDVEARLAELDTHWDTIARLPGGGSRGPAVTAELISVCTRTLEEQANSANASR